jgi:hypothetical protein
LLHFKIPKAVNEINKGNQVISSMQTESQRSHDIISTKNDVIRKQEQNIQELRSKQGDYDRQLQKSEGI